MPTIGRLVPALLIAGFVIPAYTQQRPASKAARAVAPEAAGDLVRDVIYNELHDREHDSHWEYRSECLTGEQHLVREQVETDRGPIFRLIEQNGTPLDAEQQAREDERLDEYIHSPGQIARVEHAHAEDEARLAAVMAMLPTAFLFDYEGTRGREVRIGFRPNPDFAPSGYEARIIHALAGTLVVDMGLKRMIDIRGTMAERVGFGYGLLGHIEKGGTFEIHRRQVSATHWKTDLVEVHIEGKVLMLKTVSKEEREARSDFRPVPRGTTLAEARQMLSEQEGASAEARLIPAATEK